MLLVTVATPTFSRRTPPSVYLGLWGDEGTLYVAVVKLLRSRIFCSNGSLLRHQDTAPNFQINMEPNFATVGRLFSIISDPNAPDAIVLLGAGASLKSGIPPSGEVVEIAARWAYCRSHGRSTEDPIVVRSDWLPWLHQHPWYRTDLGAAAVADQREFEGNDRTAL